MNKRQEQIEALRNGASGPYPPAGVSDDAHRQAREIFNIAHGLDKDMCHGSEATATIMEIVAALKDELKEAK